MGDNEKLSALMVKAQKGDKKAYSKLLSDVAPIIESYIKKRLSNQSDVSDIVQTCLMAIHQSRETYSPDQPFLNWVYGISKYKLMDHFRSSYKISQNEVQQPDMLETFFGNDTNMVREEAKRDLQELLKKLPQKERKLLYLLKIEGQSVADVAKKMKMTESNVKVTTHRALKLLQGIAGQERLPRTVGNT